MHTHARRTALVALALAALLAACAEPDAGSAGSGGQAAPTSTTVATTTTTGAPTTSGVQTPSTAPTEVPRDQIRTVVRGTVREGVEPGCKLLEVSQTRRWLLVGGGKDADKLVPGARVEIVGVRAAGQLSYCQQGQPLRVLSVKQLP